MPIRSFTTICVAPALTKTSSLLTTSSTVPKATHFSAISSGIALAALRGYATISSLGGAL